MSASNGVLNSNKLLLFIFSLSLILHVWFGMTHISIAQDQARDLMLMQDYIEQGTWFVGYGPKASVGDFSLPPLYYQIHLLVYGITSGHPLSMMWLILVLDSFTCIFVFLIARRYFSLAISATLSLLYLASPVALSIGTTMWNPNLIPFLSAIGLWFWLRYLVDMHKPSAIGGLVACGLIASLHFQGLFLAAFVGVVFLWMLYTRWSDIGYWVVGLLVILAFSSPYITAEFSNGFENTRAISTYSLQSNAETFDRVRKVEFVVSFLPAFIERVMIGGNLKYIQLGRFVFFAGLSLLLIYSKKVKAKYVWVFIYFLSIFLMLRVYKGDKLDYYMSVLFIMPYLLLGFILQVLSTLEFKKRIPTDVRMLVMLMLIVFIGFRAGKDISSKEPYNNLDDYAAISSYLQRYEDDGELRMFYQHQDLRHVIEYILREDKLVDRNDSRIFVDVCHSQRPCRWDNSLACKHSLRYVESGILKTDAEYTYLNTTEVGNVQLVVGELIN